MISRESVAALAALAALLCLFLTIFVTPVAIMGIIVSVLTLWYAEHGLDLPMKDSHE